MAEKRDTTELLSDFPEVEKVKVAKLQPTDVIVLECSNVISNETAARLANYVKQIWPDNKCIVLCDGIRMNVVSEEEGEQLSRV